MPVALSVKTPKNADPIPVVASRYKTKMCQTYTEKGTCPYDARCMFAHGDAELRTKEMNMTDGLTTEEAIKGHQRKVKIEAAAAAASVAYKEHGLQMLQAQQASRKPLPHHQPQQQSSRAVLHPGQTQFLSQPCMVAFQPQQQHPQQQQQFQQVPRVRVGRSSPSTYPLQGGTPTMTPLAVPTHTVTAQQPSPVSRRWASSFRDLRSPTAGVSSLNGFPAVIPLDDLDTDEQEATSILAPAGTSALGMSGSGDYRSVSIKSDSLSSTPRASPSLNISGHQALTGDDCQCTQCVATTVNVVRRARGGSQRGTTPSASNTPQSQSLTNFPASAGERGGSGLYSPSQRQQYYEQHLATSSPCYETLSPFRCKKQRPAIQQTVDQPAHAAHNPYAPWQHSLVRKYSDCTAML